MGDRVLVVDDEPSILRVVAANLRARGYEALTAASGEAALKAIETQQPDCVVLDLGLPGVDGLEVLRRLRSWGTTPVVILTARDGERDRATALELGADDYVTKPFAMTELLDRVRGALGHGRSQGPDRPRRIEVGRVCIDLDAGLVTRWGQPVRLTRTEYRLLELLATSGGRLCTSRFLSERLWGTGSEHKARSLRDHVATACAASSTTPPCPSCWSPSPAWATASSCPTEVEARSATCDTRRIPRRAVRPLVVGRREGRRGARRLC